MLELGKTQRLVVINRTEHGVYLGESRYSEDKVLLPIKQVPAGTEPGNELEVFLFSLLTNLTCEN